MNLDLDPTQELLRDTVREYLEAEVPLERIRELEREGRWDDGLWKGLCDQGWLGLPFDERFGGGDGSLVDVGVLLEAVARRAAVVPLAEALACGITLERHGDPEAARRCIEGMLSGSIVPTPAWLEAEDDLASIRLAVDGGRLRGEKCFVDYGQFATHHLVAALDGSTPALFWVDAGGPDVATEALQTIGRTPSARVRYDGAPAEKVADAKGAEALLRLSRLFAAVQCVGSAGQSLDQTVAYATVREAFGRPIGSFQAVKHHAANMAIRVSASRQLVFEALHAVGAGGGSDAQVAIAKASASRTTPEVVMLAHQIHGGNGIIEENDLYFFTLRGKDRSLAWGSLEECLAEVSGGVDAPVEWNG
ncbi:MAG: acyl-CoA dehydrogenase family protein [Myxococcota bacterium]